MSRRFWIADLHLGHEKVAQLRGFDSAYAHDSKLVSQLDKLREGDVLWNLGDISSGRPEGEERALGILKEMKERRGFEMHLIAGNHDSVSSIHRSGFKKQRKWLEVFDSIQQFGRINLHGQKVLVSHYPYARSGDGPGREGSRYEEFRLPDTGHLLIHGHTHQDTPHSEKNLYYEVGRGSLIRGKSVGTGDEDLSQICVSWDAWRRLVTEKDLNDWIMRGRQ